MKKTKRKILGITVGVALCLFTFTVTSVGLSGAQDATTVSGEILNSAESTLASTTTEASTTSISTTKETTTTTTTKLESTSTTTELTITTTKEIKETDAPEFQVEKKSTPVQTETETETIEDIVSTPQSTQEVSVSIVYKPSTHYIHTSNCHWCDNSCYEITSTEGLECRKCSECNPEIEIITPYVQPSVNSGVNYDDLSDWDITLLRKIVSNEYDSDYVPVEEKAKIVASVMNMVKDSRWPNTVEGVLDQTCAPYGFNKYNDHYMSDSIIAAVDYYFENKDTVFADWTCNQWWGDGTWNHFKTV